MYLRSCRTAALALCVLAVTVRAQRSRERVSLVFRGESALQRQELGAALTAFRLAAADTDGRRRAAAERMIAYVQWRFYHRFDLAREHIARALATGEDTAATLVEGARVALAQRRYGETFALASRANAAADDDFALRGSALQMALAVVEPALSARIDGRPVDRDAPPPDGPEARAAIAALLRLVRETPGRTEDARLLLLAALLAGDGSAAAEGARSYYLISVGLSTGAILQRTPQLPRLLEAWSGSGTTAERARLAAGLAAARLFDAAALVAPRSSELVAYAAYGRRLTRAAQEYYRRTLLGEARPDDLTRAYYRASRDLWPRLSWGESGTPPPRFYPAAVAPELARRFGTIVQLGITGGYYDLHMGHVVGDQSIEVEQYGHRARLRLLLLDGMVSNGLQTWAWDDVGGHGGWQRRDTVVQVRPVFVEHTIALLLTSDSSRRERERIGTAADSLVDWAIAAEDSIAFLPGVAARLRREGRDSLLDSLQRAGLGGPALAGAFIRVAAATSHQSSILAHEGRHAIDDALVAGASTEEREFRAKLSEIAFADRPRLVFSSIMHPNVGDATPHGRANFRIMAGLLRWMRAHAAEIPHLERSRPLLPQLPLLADEQLRRAFRSMDPLAAGSR